MANLKEATLREIANSKHLEADIVFVGSQDSSVRMEWADFLRLSDHEYDSGFGAVEVCVDLCIRFADGSLLIREEYDGSEGWLFVDCYRPGIPRIALSGLFVEGSYSEGHDCLRGGKRGN